MKLADKGEGAALGWFRRFGTVKSTTARPTTMTAAKTT